MLSFDPPELEEQLKNALIGLRENLKIDPMDIQSDFYDPTQPDYDKNGFEDEIVTPMSSCKVTLHRVDEDFEITYQELIDIVNEAQSARLKDNVECWSSYQALFRLSMLYDEANRLIEHHFSLAEDKAQRGILKHSELLNGQKISCALVRGFTIFGLLVAAGGDYDKYYPPVTEDELFLEIQFSPDLQEFIVRDVVEAYIFELGASHKIYLIPSPRLSVDWEDFWEEDDEKENPPEVTRIRPLLIGKGIRSILQLYNKAFEVTDPEIRLLFLTKVIEHASPTIVRQKLITSVQTKLLTPRALRPDAKFILELDLLFQDLRTYRKDKDAINLTVEQCCDCEELKRVAPPFLTKLVLLKDNPNQQERNGALREFADSLYATRNSVAHAKANYESTGTECPDSEIGQFLECVQLAAQQVIRWYARCPEHLRVITS
jgi:hypothetical protein